MDSSTWQNMSEVEGFSIQVYKVTKRTHCTPKKFKPVQGCKGVSYGMSQSKTPAGKVCLSFNKQGSLYWGNTMLCNFLSELGIHETISIKSFLQFFILQALTLLVLLVVHQLLIFSMKDILLHKFSLDMKCKMKNAWHLAQIILAIKISITIHVIFTCLQRTMQLLVI